MADIFQDFKNKNNHKASLTTFFDQVCLEIWDGFEDASSGFSLVADGVGTILVKGGIPGYSGADSFGRPFSPMILFASQECSKT